MEKIDSRLPLVSVVIPAYNHAKYVSRAIQSVSTQTYRNIELIIIDDGSLDCTPEEIEGALESFPFKAVFIKQENLGINKTLNKMLGLASGKYVKLLASDDELHPEGISRLVGAAVDFHHEFDLIFGDCLDGRIMSGAEPWQQIGSLERIPCLDKGGSCDITEIFSTSFCSFLIVGSLIKRTSLLKLGLFDPDLPFEDIDLYVRCIREGCRVGYTGEIVCFHRRHSTNISSSMAFIHDGYKKISEKHRKTGSRLNPVGFYSALSLLDRVSGIIPRDVLLLIGNRNLVGWGTGSTMRATLELQDVNFSYLVDSDVDRHGASLNGLPILDPSCLENEDKDQVFVYVASMFVSEIYSRLDFLGFQQGKNYY